MEYKYSSTFPQIHLPTPTFIIFTNMPMPDLSRDAEQIILPLSNIRNNLVRVDSISGLVDISSILDMANIKKSSSLSGLKLASPIPCLQSINLPQQYQTRVLLRATTQSPRPIKHLKWTHTKYISHKCHHPSPSPWQLVDKPDHFNHSNIAIK